MLRLMFSIFILAITSEAHADQISFQVLPSEKVDKIYRMKEFSGFPDKMIFKGALFVGLEDGVDLVDIDNVAPIFAGTYMVNYKNESAVRVAPNLRYSKEGILKVGNKMISVSENRMVRSGYVYESLDLISIQGTDVKKENFFPLNILILKANFRYVVSKKVNTRKLLAAIMWKDKTFTTLC